MDKLSSNHVCAVWKSTFQQLAAYAFEKRTGQNSEKWLYLSRVLDTHFMGTAYKSQAPQKNVTNQTLLVSTLRYSEVEVPSCHGAAHQAKIISL